MEADLDTGPFNYNLFYNPGGEGANARIYFSAVDGIDQGNYFELVVGTTGDDQMEDAGGSGINWFDGREGNDVITAASDGRNVLIGGLGDDTLTGGGKNDQFRGGAGNDIINGGGEEDIDGGDLVRYDRPSGSGPYTHGVVVNLSDGAVVLSDDPGEGEYYFNGLNASVASNQAIGTWEILETWATDVEGRVDTDVLSGIESVRGSTFDDILIGNEGDNNIMGDQGDDTMIAGGGDDFLVGSFGSDYIDGGEGYDAVWYGELDGVTINLAEGYADEGGGVLDTLIGIEGVNGSHGADTLIGDDGDNFFGGLAGDDYIDGGNGRDAVDFYNSTSGVIVNLAEGTAADGHGDTDTLVNIEDIWGSFHDDTLIGNSDANYIDGGDGDDTIIGGGGDDDLHGNDGNDLFVFGTEEGQTWIGDFELGVDHLAFQGEVGIAEFYEIDTGEDENADSTRVILTTGAEIILYGVTGVESASELLLPPLLGTENPETVTGTGFNDVIIGAEGDDTLIGQAGVDTYIWRAGDGNDTVIGDDSSQDVIQFEGSFYDFDWDYAGDDLIIGVVNDTNYEFAGTIRIQDFIAGGDSIAYMEADLGNNNLFYNPGGEGANARIYFSAVDGIDQGNYFELIAGTTGDDVMDDAGGSGINWFDGRAGNDIITAASDGRNVLVGGLGDDTLTGGSKNDQFRGGAGNDIIIGGGEEGIDNNDIVRYDRNAGSGPYSHGVVVNLSDATIVLSGDPGEGEYYFNGLNVSVESNQAIGNWEILDDSWESNVEGRVDTDSLSGIESVRGSTFDDVLIGNEGDNSIIGDDGDDTMIAGGGDDFLVGQFGTDYIDGGEGEFDHVYYGELDGVTINLAEGYAYEGGEVSDTLVNIEGGSGSRGVDTLIGNGGNNFFQGLAGDDDIDGGEGWDAVDYYEAPEGVVVNLEEGTALDGYGNTDTLTSIEDIWGSFHSDDLTGSSGENYIQGRGGDDTIRGGAGNDTLDGGDGFDIFVFGGESYFDSDTILDFMVGTDFLRLEDGISVSTLEDLGDRTIVTLDSGSTIELVGVTGVTDPNDLLEPQNLFFMASVPEDGPPPEDNFAARVSGPQEEGTVSSITSANFGFGGASVGHGQGGRRIGESRAHEFAVLQTAAALGGVVAAGTHLFQPAEAAVLQDNGGFERETPVSSGNSWAHGGPNYDANESQQHGPAEALPAAPIGNSAWSHADDIRNVELGGLRAAGTPANEHGDPTAKNGWHADSGSIVRSAESSSHHAGNTRDADTQAQNPGGKAHTSDAGASEGSHDASGGWHAAHALDVGPLLDFSNLPADGANLREPLGGGWHHADIKLPAIESIIDLRHDLFAEALAGPGAKFGANTQHHQPSMHDSEFGFVGPGSVEFVHNLANDLEAVAQTQDAR